MIKKRNAFMNLLYVILGNSIMAFAVTYFILPNKILTGGVAGIAVAISPLLNINPQIIMYAILVLTFILGYFCLGKTFAIKTFASSIIYPVFIEIFNATLSPDLVDPLMASIYGGLLMGIGLGVTFIAGASSGGMDIPPLILARYTKVRVSIWILVFDILTVLLGFVTYDLNHILIGIISVFSSSWAIDKIGTIGGDEARQVLIISDKTDEIVAHIHKEIDRGSTLLQATGGYTGSNKEVILTILGIDQYPELEQFVKGIDENAFLIVSNVTEVHGNGFYKS